MTRPWVIASGDFTTLGGMDRANHALARYLAGAGRDVHLVAHRVADDLRGMPGVTVHEVARPLGAHTLGAPLLAQRAGSVAHHLGRRACVLVNGGNTGLTAATWIHYLHAAYTPDAAGAPRARIAASLLQPVYRRAERAAIGRAPLVICNSERTADDVRRAYGRHRNLAVVYYGGDAATFAAVTDAERRDARRLLGLPADRRVALFVGALGDRRKGFDLLFDAWDTLAAADWDVDLVVAGAGAELAAWQQRAGRGPLASRVHFAGFRRDVATVMAAADVFVHPARYEAYGLVVHEALSRGIPALVTANAGVAERYPDALADLVLPEQVTTDQLVAALRAWRAAADEWPARVAPAAAALRARSWDDMSAEIAAAIEGAA